MRVPASTYRLQITATFDLFAAAERLPYLHDLGVDWVYLSPLLEAEAGSDHGYDVLRHDRVDPARGGAEGLAALAAAARRLGMGVLVDIVPNHVGVATPTPGTWWWDVLEHGQASAYASFFDIDWAAGGGRLLLPVLGEGDEESIEVDAGAELVRYHERTFPLRPGTATVAEQHYELVSWTRGDAELNYRRFFTVATLAAIRVEAPEVFDASHVEIERWFDEGLVDGLRVDHPDGLRDPAGYLDRLRDLTRDAYVLVEKILEPGEALLSSWATAGTTGYDAMALVDRVLTDPAGETALSGLADRLGAPPDFHELVHRTKRAVADHGLQAEVRRIVRDTGLAGTVEAETPPAVLEDAVAELLTCFPVYRSYLPAERDAFDAAVADARVRRPELASAYDALEPVLGDATQPAALRFQQTSGMVMAKGVEDCAFYRYSRLTSLNEVGGDPSVFALSVEDFHRAMAERQRDWPLAMTAGTTHDTKRGEDTRSRIAVLAEVPDVWAGALDRLLELAPLPDPAFGSLLWQAMLGVWGSSPDDELRARLHGYAEKAMREAGDRTTYAEPDPAYEQAVHAAVDAAFDSPDVRRVLESLLEQVIEPGWSNALAAKLISLTMPGVPDVYQGSEVSEQSLVDPDNRRPVDFDAAASSLADGTHPKQALVARALRLRRDRPELFTGYSPLSAEGPAAAHVLAFDRGGAVAVATRLPVGLADLGGWGDTTLLVDGRPHRVADLLGDAPAALLVTEEL